MITQTIATWQTSSWKDELRDAVTDVGELLSLVGLENSALARRALASSPFALRVPHSFVRRMERGNEADPLLHQVLPLDLEQTSPQGFSKDPLDESAYNPVAGIIHKYRGRVLLITTPVCAVNCRYCFRRHFPYGENTPGKKQWLDSLAYIAADATITEVILSGGDPLATDDRHLAWLVSEIEKIPHVARLRIHTRLPVVIPSRLDDHCLAWMAATRLQVCLVVHINHSNEIDREVSAMIGRVKNLGIPVLNQTVLLAGINAHADILIELSEKLFSVGILPYYLHLLDTVDGAGHFAVEIDEARAIYAHLQANLPGYLVPRLVRDISGKSAKTLIGPQFD